MSIATKRGDGGTTSLYRGGRVRKDHIRIEIGGAVDELCACLGLSKSLSRNKMLRMLLESIQKDLFIVGAETATVVNKVRTLKKRIDKRRVTHLEREIAKLEQRHFLRANSFYLPGQNRLSSSLDIARTVARRAERKIVSLKRKGGIKNRYLIVYMNRLSDLLYLLARSTEKKHRTVS